MKTILKYNWPAIFIIVGTLLLLMCGCVSEQKIVQRATMKVLTTKSAFDSVGRVFVGLHPCANDTVFKTHSDTTEAHDTTYTNYWSSDTVNRVDTVRQIITRKIIIHDTAIIKDRQKEKLDAELIQRLYVEASGLNATISDKNEQVSAAVKTKNKWVIIAVGTYVILAVSFAVKLYLKFKV